MMSSKIGIMFASVAAAAIAATSSVAQTPVSTDKAQVPPVASYRPEEIDHKVFWSRRITGYLTTRDGMQLRYSVILPKGKGPFPTIVQWTPYESTRERFIGWGVFYARRGYAAVVVDVRGRCIPTRSPCCRRSRPPSRAANAPGSRSAAMFRAR